VPAGVTDTSCVSEIDVAEQYQSRRCRRRVLGRASRVDRPDDLGGQVRRQRRKRRELRQRRKRQRSRRLGKVNDQVGQLRKAWQKRRRDDCGVWKTVEEGALAQQIDRQSIAGGSAASDRSSLDLDLAVRARVLAKEQRRRQIGHIVDLSDEVVRRGHAFIEEMQELDDGAVRENDPERVSELDQLDRLAEDQPEIDAQELVRIEDHDPAGLRMDERENAGCLRYPKTECGLGAEPAIADLICGARGSFGANHRRLLPLALYWSPPGAQGTEAGEACISGKTLKATRR
jgi:hypothetical protein